MIVTILAALSGLMLGYGLGVQRKAEDVERDKLAGIQQALERLRRDGVLEEHDGRYTVAHGRAHREPAGISTPDHHQ